MRQISYHFYGNVLSNLRKFYQSGNILFNSSQDKNNFHFLLNLHTIYNNNEDYHQKCHRAILSAFILHGVLRLGSKEDNLKKMLNHMWFAGNMNQTYFDARSTRERALSVLNNFLCDTMSLDKYQSMAINSV